MYSEFSLNILSTFIHFFVQTICRLRTCPVTILTNISLTEMCRQCFNVHFYRAGFLFTFINIRTVWTFSMLLNQLLTKYNSMQFCYLFYFKSCFGVFNGFSYQCAAVVILLRVNNSNFHKTRYKALKILVIAKTFIRQKKYINKYKCNIYLFLWNQKALSLAILFYNVDLIFRFVHFVSCQFSDQTCFHLTNLITNNISFSNIILMHITGTFCWTSYNFLCFQ